MQTMITSDSALTDGRPLESIPLVSNVTGANMRTFSTFQYVSSCYLEYEGFKYLKMQQNCINVIPFHASWLLPSAALLNLQPKCSTDRLKIFRSA